MSSLRETSPTMPQRAVDVGGDGVDAVRRPRHEGNGGAATVELANQREPESGRAAGDGDATSVEQ